MNFLEALKEAKYNNKRIRQVSWNKEAYVEMCGARLLFGNRELYSVDREMDTLFATDWEIYQEPALEPEPEKTLGRILSELNYKYFKGSFWDQHDKETQEKIERIVFHFESEVMRRYHESLPKIEGKTAGQVLMDIENDTWNCSLIWEKLDDQQRELYEIQAARFISAHQLAPPEPEPETAIERLFNSGFEKPTIGFDTTNYCRCSFDAFGKTWTGMKDTPEQAAAAAIEQFKNFIAGK